MIHYRLFRQMLLEDWRLHTELFGALRFAFFPVQILGFVGVASGLLTLTTVDPVQVIVGIHLLVFLFGVQTGSVAFEGADAMQNVFGDITYLVFTTRTLPVSRRTLLGIFVLKDIVYYSTLFVLPITLGFVPLYVFSSLSLTVGTVTLLFAALTLSFLLGVGTAVLAVGTVTPGSIGRVAVLVSAVALGIAWATGIPLLEYTPYRLYVATGIRDVGVAVVPVIAVLVAGIMLYSPRQSTTGRTVEGQYRRLVRTLPVDDSMVAKTVLDVSRSSGGFLKVGLVAGILFAVVAFLIRAVRTVIGISPNTALAYGSLLSLTAFTTHMWLTQLDDPDEYLFHPVSIRDVFHAKYVTFALFTIPTGGLFYGGALLYHRPGVLHAVLGGLLFTGLSVYVFGLTVFLSGLDSNDFMFDTVAFTGFSLAVMIAVLPVILVSLISPLPLALGVGVAVWSVGLAGIGTVAMLQAPSRWEDQYR